MKNRRYKRKKSRLPKSPFAVAPSTAQPDSLSIMRELNDSLLSGNSITKVNREAFERVLHDQVTKIQLHLSALALHKQMRQSKFLGLMDFTLDWMSDPDVLMETFKSDPKEALNFLKSLHKIESDDTEFLSEMAMLANSDKNSGLDLKSGLQTILGLAGASISNLPPSLQDPVRRRQFRSTVQALIDVMQGEPLPSPPETEERILTAKDETIIDAEVIEDVGYEDSF